VFAEAEDAAADEFDESTAIYPPDHSVSTAFDDPEATSEISMGQLNALMKQRKMRKTEPAPVVGGGDDDDGLEVPTAAGKRGVSKWRAPTPALALGSEAIRPLSASGSLPLASPAPDPTGLDGVLDDLGGDEEARWRAESGVTDVDAAAGLDADEVERALGLEIANRIARRAPTHTPVPAPAPGQPFPPQMRRPNQPMPVRPGTPVPIEPLVTDKVPKLASPVAKKNKRKTISFTAAASAYLLALACGVGVFWGSSFVAMPEWLPSPYLLAAVSAVASFILGGLFVGRILLVPPLFAAGATAALIAVPTIALLAPLPFVLAGLATAAALMRVISLILR
jgi:hypothetical protein